MGDIGFLNFVGSETYFVPGNDDVFLGRVHHVIRAMECANTNRFVRKFIRRLFERLDNTGKTTKVKLVKEILSLISTQFVGEVALYNSVQDKDIYKLLDYMNNKYVLALQRLYKAELEFKDFFAKRKMKPAFMICMLDKKASVKASSLSHNELFVLFKQYDVFDDYLRKRECEIAYLKTKLQMDKKIAGYFFRYFEAFKSQALSWRPPKLLDAQDRNARTNAANELTLRWIKENLNEYQQQIVLKYNMYHSSDLCYRHINNIALKSELEIHFILAFLLDDALEIDCEKYLPDVVAGFKKACTTKIARMYLQSCKRLQESWPKSDILKASESWIRNIGLFRKTYGDCKSLDSYFKQRHLEVGAQVHNVIVSETAGIPSDVSLNQYAKTSQFLIYENDLHSFAKETRNEDIILNVMDLYRRLNPQYNWQNVLVELEKQNHDYYQYVLSLRCSIWHQLFHVTEGTANTHRMVPRYWENMLKCSSSTLMFPSPKIYSCQATEF